MTSRTQQIRFYKADERPARGDAPVGAIYVNTADKQIGVMGDLQDVEDLIAVRVFSERAHYRVGDIVVHGHSIYRNVLERAPGPWNITHWELLEAAKGDKGDRGERGPQGVQGVQGIKGERGERGAPGEIGTPVGDFKFRAPAELPPSGLLPAHWDGPDRPATPLQIKIGQGLIHSTDGHIWIYVGTSEDPNGWIDGGHIVGPPGPPGETGPAGPIGSQGPRGETGPAGRIARPIGDFTRPPAELPYDGFMVAGWDRPNVPPVDLQIQMGDALEHIPTGDWWLFVTDVEDAAGWINIGKIRGEQGIPGAQGPMGPVGPAGKDGKDGRDGVDGSVGVMGPPGPAGAASTVPGPQGPAGPSFADTTIISTADPDPAQGGNKWLWCKV